MTGPQTQAASSGALYRTLWRWHFYAGLFVLPFIIILSVTGSIYLFKPQIDQWQDRAYRGLGTAQAVPPEAQLSAALAANPAARFNAYRLPEQDGDAALIQLGMADGSLRDVYVSPQGQVLGSRTSYSRFSDLIAKIHGSLMLGDWGDRLVELAASWTIVMILTGLYLWWPRPFAFAGTFWPRLSLRGRPLLKDLHRVIGVWIAALVLVMLASGLPWAGTWGSALAWTRAELGWVKGAQDWKIGASEDHAVHDHGAMMAGATAAEPAPPPGLPLSAFVDKARAEHMAFPVLVLPPHAVQRFEPPTGAVWTAKSEPQNRPLGRQVSYDPATGVETTRSGFADKHIVDRVVNYGIAWHEGQLFGWPNQLMGVVTALLLIGLSVMGILMWLRRRPQGRLGAPPAVTGARLGWTIAALVVLGLLLPLFGASALAILALERLVRMVRRRRVQGVQPT